MIRTEQPDTADATQVRREWRTPEVHELSADATATGGAVVVDGLGSS